MGRFVATYNDPAVAKLRQRGIFMRNRTLVFDEDDLTSARTFFRRYVRNFFGVKLHDMEFSLYEQAATPASSFGLLTDDEEIPQSTPGMCGARSNQPETAP